MDNKSELKHAENKLRFWYFRELGKILNVISAPYNSPIIFNKLVFELLKNNKKVLWITNDYKENEEVIEYIRRNLGEIKCSYIKGSTKNLESGILYFINASNIASINEEVDLLVYDDISFFSNYTKLQVMEKINKIYSSCNKIIVYSIESIYTNMENFEVSAIKNISPIIEPRNITTRINLQRDIPYMLYEYFKWFKDSKRKIILHVPTKEYGDNLYELYTTKIKLFSDVNIIRFHEVDEIRKLEKILSMKNEPLMIITEYIGENISSLGDLDIVVMEAENKRFDYKKIVYLCGKVGVREKYLGEIILISKEVNKNMEKAKEITRYFNKLVWERGLSKVQNTYLTVF